MNTIRTGQLEIEQVIRARALNAKGDIWRYKARKPDDPWRRMHADLINSIRAGSPINEAQEAAESHLISIMGRMSAYTGQAVRWSDAMESKLDLMPKDLKFGAMEMPAVAMPGREKLT